MTMTRSGEAWVLFLLTRAVGLAADVSVLACAYWGAFLLRFDFAPPRWGWRAVALSFVTMLFVRHGDVKAAAKKGLEAFEDMED